MRKHTPTSTTDATGAIAAAVQAGFDLSLIEASLAYSYDKRAAQHQAALDLIMEMQKAGSELRGRA